MPTIGNTPRPGYVYDQETDTWIPIGVGPHTHSYVDLTLIDAKGDLLVGSSADTVSKLSVGSADQVLTVDSSTTTGLKWATPTSGLTLISSNILTSATQTITFSSIPGTYKNLKIIAYGKTGRVGTNSDLRLRFNSDTTANNYQRVGQGGNAGNAGGDWGDVIPYSSFTQAPLTIEITIPQYAATTFKKDAIYWMTYQNSADVTPAGTNNFVAGTGGFRWDSTAAITTIAITDVYSTFSIGSSFQLYGLA